MIFSEYTALTQDGIGLHGLGGSLLSLEPKWLRSAGVKFIGCGPSEGCSGTPDIPLLAWACGSVRARAARTQTFHPEPTRQLGG